MCRRDAAPTRRGVHELVQVKELLEHKLLALLNELAEVKELVEDKVLLGLRASSGGVQALIEEFMDMLLKGEAHCCVFF